MKTETKHPVLLQQIQGKKKVLIDFPIYVAMSIVYINILSTSKRTNSWPSNLKLVHLKL